MISIKRVRTSDKEYAFAEQLLMTAFPPEEHRELETQRDFTDNNELFYNNIILENDIPMGIVSFWNFNDFYYIEHFAISPDYRNGGCGKKVLEYLNQQISAPIVLEVELPETEMSKRRINFYKRIGYKLIQEEYYQPPYRKQDNKLPMFLMVYDQNQEITDFTPIKKKLYKYVYNVDENYK